MELSIQKESLNLFWQSPPEFAISIPVAFLDKFPYLSSLLPELKECLVVDRVSDAPDSLSGTFTGLKAGQL